VRCGAFADEQSVVAGDEGGRVRTRKQHAIPCKCEKRDMTVGALELERVSALFTPARSSPPSLALCPRVAAPSPMSGAS
jgi:hypothetical protein